jgi:hypothetical protein
VTTDEFIQDLRARVIGVPEFSTDGFHPYKNAIRDAFGSRVAHGVVQKTYSVVHLNVNEGIPALLARTGNCRRVRHGKRRTFANLDQLRGTP